MYHYCRSHGQRVPDVRPHCLPDCLPDGVRHDDQLLGLSLVSYHDFCRGAANQQLSGSAEWRVVPTGDTGTQRSSRVLQGKMSHFFLRLSLTFFLLSIQPSITFRSLISYFIISPLHFLLHFSAFFFLTLFIVRSYSILVLSSFLLGLYLSLNSF